KTTDKLFKPFNKQTERIDLDYRVKTSNPEVRHIQVNAVVKYKNKKPAKSHGIIIDITAQKENEIELYEKNQELEQFARIVSHDLLTPLNSVIGFADLLKEKFASLPQSREFQYTNKILESSTRMKTLITELLEYSHIDGIKKLERIECNEIVEEVVTDLDSIVKKTDCKIKYDSLPVIEGCRINISRLFENLISNSIKFRKQNSTPEIVIKGRESANFFEFSVEDNGTGIGEDDINEIFKVFKRAENSEKVAGYGIGLAACKKIVNDHGGDIWVISTQGKGSTFYFTIKK
ncbi:His Kinase A (phospho-acceptor) domain-containing protein, partial [Bacteroides faecichinchillae]